MKITEILNIKFNYQMTESLLALLFDEEKRNTAFEQYLATDPDLSQDCFLAEFQAQFADRSGLKQDYTPSSICRIVADISGNAESVLDVCSGTGALTLAKWAQCPSAKFYCEEYSKEAVAILLFNLALRGVNAEVRHGDVLTGETFAGYRISRKTGKNLPQRRDFSANQRKPWAIGLFTRRERSGQSIRGHFAQSRIPRLLFILHYVPKLSAIL